MTFARFRIIQASKLGWRNFRPSGPDSIRILTTRRANSQPKRRLLPLISHRQRTSAAPLADVPIIRPWYLDAVMACASAADDRYSLQLSMKNTLGDRRSVDRIVRSHSAASPGAVTPAGGAPKSGAAITLDSRVPPHPPFDLSTQNNGVGPSIISRTSGVTNAARQLSFSASVSKQKSFKRSLLRKFTADRMLLSPGCDGTALKRN